MAIVEGYPSDQGRTLDGFFEGEKGSLEKSISCGFFQLPRYKILIMSAHIFVYFSMAWHQVHGPWRPDRIAAWLRLGYPGEPQKTTTALAYSPLNNRTYSL